MKTLIRNIFILMSIFCSCNQIFAMKSSRAGTAYVGKWVRPNAKSSLRYFAVSPDRGCKTVTRVTPISATKTFGSQRELSFGQIGSGLFKKARWSLTSREDKKTELFDALENNILTQNQDQTLPSIIALFKTENLLNELMDKSSGNYFIVTPLKFAIKKSQHTNPKYQEELIETFIKNGAQGLAKALYFALENYNEGAIRALVHSVNPQIRKDFFQLAQKNLEKNQAKLEDVIVNIRENAAHPDLPGQVGLIQLYIDLMGKLYANASKLKKIVDLKKDFKEHGDLESEEIRDYLISKLSEKESSF